METALPTSPVDFVGPFEHHKVVVEGWTVPLLDAQPLPGGRVTLRLDERFDLDLSIAEAERVVPFIANAIAVALGFTCHPRGDEEPKSQPPLSPRRVVKIAWFDSAPPDSDQNPPG